MPSDVNGSREEKSCAAASHSLNYHIKRHLKVVSFGSAVNRDSATDTLSSTCLESRHAREEDGEREVEREKKWQQIGSSKFQIQESNAKLTIESQQQAYILIAHRLETYAKAPGSTARHLGEREMPEMCWATSSPR